ncbi:MAG: GNAT family N-acetyltransferase [Thermoleophilia bacterium]|nr:GNAT family N-acetyltransferase [Thermoleophilia bacterium]
MRDAAALTALIEAIPGDPPYDVSLAPSDPALPLLRQAGFEQYATTFAVSRAIEGFPSGSPSAGVRLLTYTNDMADRYEDAEWDALDGLATFTQMGRPTGYAQGAGYGDFTVALRDDSIIGFCFTQVPEGIVWWMGVRRAERRKGVGRMLLVAAARATKAAGGTHLLAEPEDVPEARAFLRALRFRDRGTRDLLLQRGELDTPVSGV